jgi:hypothetical protein
MNLSNNLPICGFYPAILIYPIPAPQSAKHCVRFKVAQDPRQPIGPRRRIVIGDRHNVAFTPSQSSIHSLHHAWHFYFDKFHG